MGDCIRERETSGALVLFNRMRQMINTIASIDRRVIPIEIGESLDINAIFIGEECKNDLTKANLRHIEIDG